MKKLFIMTYGEDNEKLDVLFLLIFIFYYLFFCFWMLLYITDGV